MRILISSYSFGAGRGSEAGVGWNIATGLAARGHDICVVTTSEFHHLNAAALEKSDLPLRLVEFDAGITCFNSARSYRCWQRSVGPVLRRLVAEDKYDLIHHVTFNQYRALRDVFEVDIPYVIGPIGGAETVHPRFWPELPLSMAMKEAVRYIPWDVLPLKYRIAATPDSGVVLASTPQTEERLKCHGGLHNVRLTPVISLHDDEIMQSAPQGTQERYFVFDGGTRPEKGLKLMLRALSALWASGIKCPLKVAAVDAAAKHWVRRHAQRVGLPLGALELLPFMPRVELLNILRGACGFVSVGFRDAGCMALLEAIAQGVPSLCLDLAGQHWLPSEYVIKVPVDAPDIEQRITEGLCELVHQLPRSPEWHIARAEWLKNHMSWRVRLDYLEQIYGELLEASAESS